MCEIDWLPKLLVWSFVGAALVLALVSRKLNDHLVAAPEQPTGLFSAMFRSKYHVRPHFLLEPRRHFDRSGQGWARLLLRLLIVSAGLLAMLVYVMRVCERTIGQ